MENVMSAKNMFAALLLGAFMCVPVAMNADCGNKAKVECAKEASKEDGMACCKKKNSKEAKQLPIHGVLHRHPSPHYYYSTVALPPIALLKIQRLRWYAPYRWMDSATD